MLGRGLIFAVMEHNTEQKEKTPADLFLQTLRQATAPMHTQLEENAISKSLMNPGVSLTDYAFYLRCMGEVMKVYDTQVLPAVSTVITDGANRKKSRDIDMDLDFLYMNGAEKKETKPFVGFMGNPSLPYALGYAYVIEGSTLGGRVILKHINQALKIEQEGAKFFGGYGAETGKYWKDFLQAFCIYILSNKGEEEAIKGAIDGFSDIHRHFTQHG